MTIQKQTCTRTWARTIFSRLLLGLLMLVCALPMAIVLCLPTKWVRRSKVFYYCVGWFYRIILRFTLLPITFKGKEHVPTTPVIFAANHQSSLDIPLVGVLARGKPHIWLAKQELMDSPILRFVLPRLAILVDMTTPLKGMRSLLQVVAEVKSNPCSIMIFPEGGRYIDDTVHEFYGGFTVLAKATGMPVVPVRIFGVNKVYPPDSFLVYYCPITVVIGKPITYTEGESDQEFKDRVYQWFIQQQE